MGELAAVGGASPYRIRVSRIAKEYKRTEKSGRSRGLIVGRPVVRSERVRLGRLGAMENEGAGREVKHTTQEKEKGRERERPKRRGRERGRKIKAKEGEQEEERRREKERESPRRKEKGGWRLPSFLPRSPSRDVPADTGESREARGGEKSGKA